MKRLVAVLVCILLILFLTACISSSGYSEERYKEISEIYLINYAYRSPEKTLEFFEYETEGISVGSIYYGCYYSADNEVTVPDFYMSDNLGEKYEDDGGTYFGKPNSGTDWCFIKQLSDKWFYYELHWG